MAARCFISAKIESEPFQRGNDFECKRIRKGDREAESKLIPLVYKELRRLAGFYLSGERPDHTLHRLLWYAKLLHLTQLKEIDWQSSSHFFAISSQMMRRILIDHARAQLSEKRGSRVREIPFEELPDISAENPERLLALESALTKLDQFDHRQCQVVELRFFGGLTEDESAVVLGISTRTVKRDWRLARTWLYREISAKDAN
jgi:RNA polymerase sigma-70 factor (ECF subfamily)